MPYDPNAVLAQIDAHRMQVLLLCGGAMLFNYIWFWLALRAGDRDRVYPVPMVNTIVWLCGDGGSVLKHDLYFNVYNHWYLELFWYALFATACFEIYYLWQILRYGGREWLGEGREGRWPLVVASVFAMFALMFVTVTWALPDDLNIIYFNIANLIGPIAMAALILRRRSIAGTTSAVWYAYAIMLCFWYTGLLTSFGPAFQTPVVAAYALVNIAASVALGIYVRGFERSAAVAGAGEARALAA